LKRLLLVVSVFVILIGYTVNKPVITYGENLLSYKQYQAKTKETRNISISFMGHPSSYLRVRSNNIKFPVTLGFESLDIVIPNDETVRVDNLKQGNIKFKLERIRPGYSEIPTTNERTRRIRKRSREKLDKKEYTIHIGVNGNENDIQRNYDFGKYFQVSKKVDGKEKTEL